MSATPTTPALAANDEGQLVARARSGDTEAFTDLVNRYERKIYRLAKHITQNDEDAEDVLQDAFLKAYEHLDTFKGDSKFYTWIVRIAVNEALMRLRKRAQRPHRSPGRPNRHRRRNGDKGDRGVGR